MRLTPAQAHLARLRPGELLRVAIATTTSAPDGPRDVGSATRFARVIGVAPRTVRYWLARGRGIPGPVRALCLLLARHPDLVDDLPRD